MKRIVQQIISIFLTVVVLTANNTYAVTSHFCHGNLVDISYFGNPETCGMDQNDKNDSSTQLKNNCCSDSTQILESDIENLIAKDSQHIKCVNIVFDIDNKSTRNLSGLRNFHDFISDKSPPDLDIDFQILFETFLI